MIAQKCAHKRTRHGNTTPFERYISRYSTLHDSIVRLTEEERHLGTMVNCPEHDPQKNHFDHQKYKVSSLKRELKAVGEQLEVTLTQCSLPFRSGPVTSSLGEAFTRARYSYSGIPWEIVCWQSLPQIPQGIWTHL